MKKHFLLLCLLILANFCYGDILYVDKEYSTQQLDSTHFNSIQDAVNAVPILNNEPYIINFINGGEYEITNTINIEEKRIHFRGNNTTTIKNISGDIHVDTFHLFMTNNAQACHYGDVSFEGITFRTTLNDIDFNHAAIRNNETKLLVKKCKFYHNKAIHNNIIANLNEPYNIVEIDDCNFASVSNTNSPCINNQLGWESKVIINNNTFNNANFVLTHNGFTGLDTYNLLFTNNKINYGSYLNGKSFDIGCSHNRYNKCLIEGNIFNFCNLPEINSYFRFFKLIRKTNIFFLNNTVCSISPLNKMFYVCNRENMKPKIKLVNNIFSEFENLLVFNNDTIFRCLLDVKHNCFNSTIAEFINPSTMFIDTSINNLESSNILNSPVFTNPTTNDFSLKWTSTAKSPCIGTGFKDRNNDGINDPIGFAGNTTDIGAIPYGSAHKNIYEFKVNPSTGVGIKWCSFPVLDTIYDTSNPASANPWEGDKDNIRDLFKTAINPQPIPSKLTEIHFQDVQDGNIEKIFKQNQIDMAWDNENHTLLSSRGYKVKVNQNFTLPKVIGQYNANPTINMPEAKKQYWVAYNLHYSQNPIDALGDLKSNISQITGQYWGAKKILKKVYDPNHNPPVYMQEIWSVGREPGKPFIIKPQEMVILTTSASINNFTWHEPPYVIDPNYTPVSNLQHFSYTEEFDYTPLFIEFDKNEPAKEVAVFANGRCIGASVIADTMVYVCSYDKNLPAGTELEIVKYPNTRSYGANQPKVFNQQLNAYYQGSIKTDKNQDCYMISYRSKLNTGVSQANTQLTAFNTPNPFNPSTKICFNNPYNGKVKVDIYNVKGQKVKTLANKHFDAGVHKLYWNGKNANNQTTGSGVYFYKIKTQNKTIVNKMLMLK